MKSDGSAQRGKKKAPSRVRWIVSIFFMTVFVSAMFSYVSSALLSDAQIVVAFVILFVIVFIGILFDIIGVAVAAADERPFHSMAARAGHAFDQEFSDLTAQRRILVRRERGEVGMAVDFL